jgi:hypothetical protein
MTRLPIKYSDLNSKELETELYEKVIRYRYFTINFEDQEKIIDIMRKHFMIKQITLNIIQSFGPGTPRFSIHFKGSELGSIANGYLNTSRAFIAPVGDNAENQDMLNITMEEKYIVFSIIAGENTTQGQGWGLIEYIDMQQVPGYRRL